MLEFVVTEIRQFRIEAENDTSAILNCRTGSGKLLRDQYVANILPKTSDGYGVKQIPKDQWPLWAKVLSRLSKPGDKGLGDVVSRTIGPENSEAFKKWFKMTFGKDCGCAGRQREWNLKYPLP
jgi:hypothetical protein